MEEETMEFMNAVKQTLYNEYNVSVTENGAVGYRSTGKELLDLNFAVASLRKMSDEEVVKRFKKAFCEDQILAMRWLFYARDCREGLGERRLFRVVLNNLAHTNPEIVIRVVPLVAEYGREDDLWCLLDTECKEYVLDYCAKKLNNDIEIMKKCGYANGLRFISR